MDAELTFCEHVRRVTSSYFFHLRRLRQIRKHVSRQVMKQLVHAFVISRLDYSNGILAGLPMKLLGQLHVEAVLSKAKATKRLSISEKVCYQGVMFL